MHEWMNECNQLKICIKVQAVCNYWANKLSFNIDGVAVQVWKDWISCQKKIHLHFDVKQEKAAEHNIRAVFSLKALHICISDQSYINKVVSFHVKIL